MMNAKKKILELVNKEDIEAISLGQKGWDDPRKTPLFFGKDRVDEALKLLDFNFDSGYGGEEGYALYVWTKDWIIVKETYDGAEWYIKIPRNPTDKVMPESIGG